MLKIFLNAGVCLIITITFIGDYILQENNNTEPITKHVVVENIYEDYDELKNKSINIKYPSISGLDNEDLQQSINQEIKNTALSILNDFTGLDNMDIQTEYSVKLMNQNFFSIMFTDRSLHPSQAYPLIRAHTLNIDLNSGVNMRLNNILEIDENICDIFVENFKNVTEYGSYEGIDKINKYVADIVKYDNFINSDNKSSREMSSYITNDSLVIVVDVPYGIGSIALFGCNYSDLSEYMNPNVVEQAMEVN